MSFEDFPREVCEGWSDVGLVYTRNKYGRISSPPGYSLGSKNDCSFKNNLFRGASCSLNVDDNTFNPQSLFLICLDFVAKNISMVESLEGFPDIVGEQLFKKVQENDGFGHDPKNLKLFCEAYGELVLSKLSLSSAYVLTSNYSENFQLFVCLTELDVSHCRLGDMHELLSYISHIHSLIRLSLKENCLSDAGVRKFTLPRRLLKGGLGKLSVLDLSLNPDVTDESVKHIEKLNSLTALNLSGTRISFGHGVPLLMNHTNLCLALDVEEFKPGKAFTVTEGWAIAVINEWREKSISCTGSFKENKQLQGKSTKFYKSKCPGLVQRSAPKNKTVSELPKIVLCSRGKQFTCSKSTEMQAMETISMKCGKDNVDTARNRQPKKKLKTSGKAFVASSIIDEECLEDDFIKEYLNCEKQWKPVQRKFSLLESLDHVR